MDDEHTRSPPPNAHNPESIRATADGCQQLVNQAAAGAIGQSQLVEDLRNLGITVDEAQECLEQLLD
jgi:hypothetical protein